MYAEFIVPLDSRVLQRFGLVTLGCCEAMDSRLPYVNLPNLRRVSMSRWVDPEIGAVRTGRELIYSFKPSSTTHLERWNEEVERSILRGVLEKTKDCIVEIVQASITTCVGNPGRLSRWCRIAKEEARRFGGEE